MAQISHDLTRVYKLTTVPSFWHEWNTEHDGWFPTLEYSSWSDRLFVLLPDDEHREWAELYDTTGSLLKTVEIIDGELYSAHPAVDTSGVYITRDFTVIQKHDFEMNYPPLDVFEYPYNPDGMTADNVYLYVGAWSRDLGPPHVAVIDKETHEVVRSFGEYGTGPGQFSDIVPAVALFPPLPEPPEMVPAASAQGKRQGAAQAVEKAALAPRMFTLFQNFPNPCRESTTMSYQLAKASHTRLKVYDVIGRVVRTLVDDRREPGTYTARWDLKADNGHRVISGVYFCRLTAGDSSATRKMLVLG